MLTVISIDYVPGVCDRVIPYFHGDCTVLPTHTDIVKHRDLAAGLASCLQNIIHRLQHLRRCTSATTPVVCTHWFDVPLAALGTPMENLVIAYLERHTRDLIDAFGIEYRHVPVVLHVHANECLERLITAMDGEEIGIHQIHQYTEHLRKVPGTHVITVPYDGMDIRYICECIVERVTVFAKHHGL